MRWRLRFKCARTRIVSILSCRQLCSVRKRIILESLRVSSGRGRILFVGEGVRGKGGKEGERGKKGGVTDIKKDCMNGLSLKAR